ncbi:MAG: hypothetical protein JWL61_3775 [Gemmatimonadetes bacterium]|jgi:mannosyltransferase|nr:hypothetical protein [Gemmatimonadota bacterium]
MLVYDGIVFSLQRAGGISVLFTEILSRLPATGYELVGFRHSPPPALVESTYTFQSPRVLERYRRARVNGRCDLFHSTYYRLPEIGRCKVVTTVYDFVYERFAPVHRRVVHSAQKRKAIEGADILICISESTRRDMVDFVGPAHAARAVVVPLGVSEEFRAIPHTDILPQVLFVGARSGYKNFRALVDALAGLPDLNLVCVGGGPFTADETDLLQRRIPLRYRSLGYVSTGELNLQYNQSLCLVYPSLYEGFGIPILEAMRAGCPVIAVNRSSIPEVAGDAALLLENGHPEEIRSAIQRLMVSQNRQELVAKGMTQAAKFSWHETYRQTLAVYEALSGKAVV